MPALKRPRNVTKKKNFGFKFFFGPHANPTGSQMFWLGLTISPLWGNGGCLRDPGPHTRAIFHSQWPSFLNFISGFSMRRQLPKKPTNNFFLLASLLIFEMPISGGSAKRQRMVFFCFRKIYFALRKILGQSLFRKLFILFTTCKILLKSRVCLHHTPHCLKAGFPVYCTPGTFRGLSTPVFGISPLKLRRLTPGPGPGGDYTLHTTHYQVLGWKPEAPT